MSVHTVQLGDFVSIVGGGTPSRDRPEFFNGLIPWVTVKDLGSEIFLRSAQEHISQAGLDGSASRLISAGNVLLATRMAVGRAVINKVEVAINQDLKALSCGPGLHPGYLLFFLNHKAPELEAKATGATVKGITIDEIESLEIPLRAVSEQKRIARLLEETDRLRRSRRYALELSDSFLAAVFLELFGDLNSNAKGWTSNVFDEVCAIDAPLVDPKKLEYRNLPHIGGDNIESVTGRIVRFRTAAEDGLISSKFLIGPDHILFSKIRPKLRKVSEPRMVALCSADIYPIRPRSNALILSYLVGFLRSDYFSRIVSSLAESRTNIPKINREELSDIPVLLPPIAEQEKFAASAKLHERMLARQREALCQADHLFQSLLHRAFSENG